MAAPVQPGPHLGHDFSDGPGPAGSHRPRRGPPAGPGQPADRRTTHGSTPPRARTSGQRAHRPATSQTVPGGPGRACAMYTISALWTHVREGLDITTVISANDSYAFLGMGIPAPRYTCGRPRSPQPSRSAPASTSSPSPAAGAYRRRVPPPPRISRTGCARPSPSRDHISSRRLCRRCSERAPTFGDGSQRQGQLGRGSRAGNPRPSCRRGSAHLLSLPPVVSMRTARPASSRAAGMRNGEQET